MRYQLLSLLIILLTQSSYQYQTESQDNRGNQLRKQDNRKKNQGNGGNQAENQGNNGGHQVTSRNLNNNQNFYNSYGGNNNGGNQGNYNNNQANNGGSNGGNQANNQGNNGGGNQANNQGNNQGNNGYNQGNGNNQNNQGNNQGSNGSSQSNNGGNQGYSNNQNNQGNNQGNNGGGNQANNQGNNGGNQGYSSNQGNNQGNNGGNQGNGSNGNNQNNQGNNQGNNGGNQGYSSNQGNNQGSNGNNQGSSNNSNNQNNQGNNQGNNQNGYGSSQNGQAGNQGGNQNGNNQNQYHSNNKYAKYGYNEWKEQNGYGNNKNSQGSNGNGQGGNQGSYSNNQNRQGGNGNGQGGNQGGYYDKYYQYTTANWEDEYNVQEMPSEFFYFDGIAACKGSDYDMTLTDIFASCGACTFNDTITITGTVNSSGPLPGFVQVIPKICDGAGKSCTSAMLENSYMNLCTNVEECGTDGNHTFHAEFQMPIDHDLFVEDGEEAYWEDEDAEADDEFEEDGGGRFLRKLYWTGRNNNKWGSNANTNTNTGGFLLKVFFRPVTNFNLWKALNGWENGYQSQQNSYLGYHDDRYQDDDEDGYGYKNNGWGQDDDFVEFTRQQIYYNDDPDKYNGDDESNYDEYWENHWEAYYAKGNQYIYNVSREEQYQYVQEYKAQYTDEYYEGKAEEEAQAAEEAYQNQQDNQDEDEEYDPDAYVYNKYRNYPSNYHYRSSQWYQQQDEKAEWLWQQNDEYRRTFYELPQGHIYCYMHFELVGRDDLDLDYYEPTVNYSSWVKRGRKYYEYNNFFKYFRNWITARRYKKWGRSYPDGYEYDVAVASIGIVALLSLAITVKRRRLVVCSRLEDTGDDLTEEDDRNSDQDPYAAPEPPDAVRFSYGLPPPGDSLSPAVAPQDHVLPSNHVSPIMSAATLLRTSAGQKKIELVKQRRLHNLAPNTSAEAKRDSEASDYINMC